MRDRVLKYLFSLSAFQWSVILFAPLILIGVLAHSAYGLAWDESTQRWIGMASFNYLIHGVPLEGFKDADYGVGFELPLIFIEKLLGITESHKVFMMRHLVTHLFFLTGAYFAYWLIYRMTSKVWLAILGVLLLVFQPVLFAHSFFNTKDIPFMAWHLVCYFLIFESLKSYKTSIVVLTGIALGYLINLRIMGILLWVIFIGMMVVDILFHRKDRAKINRGLISIALVVFFTLFTLYVSWPYLYANPLENFAQAFENMSKFRWHGDVLYMSEMISAKNLPWHYVLVWFAISTPLIYTILGISGIAIIVIQFLGNPVQTLQNNLRRNYLIYAASIVAPLFAVIIFKSVLYDGWRHMFFVYAPFSLLAVYSCSLINLKAVKWTLFLVLGLTFGSVATFMISQHPYQHIYFSKLLTSSEPEALRKQFDLDYWGTAYYEGIKTILCEDKRSKVRLQFANSSGKFTVKLRLPEAMRDRIVITDENPDYFLTEYRFHPNDYDQYRGNKFHDIKVNNNTILSIFSIQSQQAADSLSTEN